MSLTLDHTFTFNPDGTGKVALRWDGPAAGNDPDSFVRSEIANAQGVDAWSGVSTSVDGETLRFEATAYFTDITKLRFHCQGFHCTALDFVTSTEDGVFTLRSAGEPAPAKPDKARETQLRKRIADERAKFEQMKPMIAGLFGQLNACATIELPGKIAKVANAKKLNDHAVRVEFIGERILAVLERLMTDDELAMKFLRAGGGPDAAAGLIEGMGPLQVATKGKLAPLFDYEAEAGGARAQTEALAQQFGARPKKQGPPMNNARIVACKVVREADGDRELHPMGQNYPSLVFTIAGDLPVPANSLEEASLDSAIADDGAELAPEDDWGRRIHFPKMTKDHATAFFDVELKPNAPVTGLKSIEGSLKVVVANRKEEVDLGFKKLAAEEAGSKLGATLNSINDEGEQTRFELGLKVSKDAVEDIAVLDAKGKRLPTSINGYSSSGDECQLSIVVEGKLPAKGRLTARVATDLQAYDVLWKIENVDGLGNPR